MEHLECANQMLDLSPKLANLCKPLFSQTPVSVYSYCEVDANGKFYLLSTNRGLLEDTLRAKELRDDISLYPKYLRPEGFFLSDLRPDFQKDAHAFSSKLLKIGKGHECSFVERTGNSSIRVHFFFGNLGDPKISPFYLNNTGLLRYFCRFVKNELQPQLRAVTPYALSQTDKMKAKAYIRSVKSAELSIPKFLLSFSRHKSVSKRQWEIIYWYLMGKTADETAIILGVKQGTVETHFNRIKKKLGCQTKQQILSELFCHTEFWNEFAVSVANKES